MQTTSFHPGRDAPGRGTPTPGFAREGATEYPHFRRPPAPARPRIGAALLLLTACVAPVTGGPSDGTAADSADVETLPGSDTAEIIDDERVFFADTGVLEVGIELSEAAIDELEGLPTEYVSGAMIFRGERYEPVGVRLKGSSTYQWLDGKPAWKLKFDEFEPGVKVFGLERLTLDSNYWDGAMMAETLAYRTWRLSGNPAPRTGYANVTLNGEPYGLYTIVEAMDDTFIDTNWPGSEGGLYEMCRSCDFNLDCAQYPIQETGDNFDEFGLARACASAATGNEADMRTAFDWDRLTRYMALERVVNHADSYSYNRNNYYVYHDPLTEQLTLTPWGADSTFSYTYPPDEVRPCEPGYFDNLAANPGAYLASWCMGNEACWADVEAHMLELSEQMVADDLQGFILATHDRLAESVAADPRWPWGVDTWESKVDCFHQWVVNRPAQVEAFVEQPR